MAVTVKNKKGQDVTLYNPAEKSAKYCRELKTKTHQFGKKKGQALSANEAAWRSGYMAARTEESRIWKKKNGR